MPDKKNQGTVCYTAIPLKIELATAENCAMIYQTMKLNYKGMVLPARCGHVKLWVGFQNQSHAVENTLT